MIKTFATKETAAVFDGRNVRKYSSDLQSAASRKLTQLDLAQNIEKTCAIPQGIAWCGSPVVLMASTAFE